MNLVTRILEQHERMAQQGVLLTAVFGGREPHAVRLHLAPIELLEGDRTRYFAEVTISLPAIDAADAVDIIAYHVDAMYEMLMRKLAPSTSREAELDARVKRLKEGKAE